MDRRDWLIASAAATGSALTMTRLRQPQYTQDLRANHSRIAVLHSDKYSDKLDELVYQGLRLFNLNVRGKSVLLKPNIVEHIPGKPVNTDARLIGATAEAFLRLDAASITVGEGPGHHRTRNCCSTRPRCGINLPSARSTLSISIVTNRSKRSFVLIIPVSATCGFHDPYSQRISSCRCRK